MSTLERIQGRSSVYELATSFRYARSQAITQKIPFSVKVDIDHNRYWLINIDTDAISKVRVLDPAIKISSFSDEEETVREGSFVVVFYPYGNSSGGLIVLESVGETEPQVVYSLTLDPVTGKPHVEQTTQ